MPLFPELLEPLRLARQNAAPGAVYVIQRYRQSSVNLRTRLLHTLEKAGVEPWPKLFQNLRFTRQTELAQTWPEYIVCKWMGNSERVAVNHYLQMTDDHFKQAAGGMAPGAPVRASSGAQPEAAEAQPSGEPQTGAQPKLGPQAHPEQRNSSPRDRDGKGGAKSGAAHAGGDSQGGALRFRSLRPTFVKTTTNENVPAGAGTCESIGMGAVGLEDHPNSSGNPANSATGGAESGASDPALAELLALWSHLAATTRIALLQLARAARRQDAPSGSSDSDPLEGTA